MKFTKMHGIGNDYIYINCFEEEVKEPARLAELLSQRHFGIGSDGLILIKPSEHADFYMEMYNADGSLGSMCGNGIRCVAKYVYDHGLTNMTNISVETASGIKPLQLTVKDGRVTLVTVDMGAPILTSNGMNLDLSVEQEAIEESILWETLEIDQTKYQFIGVSMGNPHAVVFLDSLEHLDIQMLGPQFEHHPRFPGRTNTEFVQVIDSKNLKMRVWERGSGETLACGTGACACSVAAMLANYVSHNITVQLLGGSLQIHWSQDDGHIWMTGPATEVFEGEFMI